MAQTVIATFARGELAPSMFGRVDASAYFSGLKRAYNGTINQLGGFFNRPGLSFIAGTFKHDSESRLFPFVFGAADTHLLEFGDEYIRPYRNDGQILETAASVSGATQANPVVITTSSAHGYATGDEVWLFDVAGMTELNNKVYKITVTSSTEFSLQSQISGDNIDGTGFSSYTSGGDAQRVFTIESPYTEDDLKFIQVRQSFDVVFIQCKGHPPRQLIRNGLTSWTLEEEVFIPQNGPPESLQAIQVGGSTGSNIFRYAVTAVDAATGEESLPGLSNSSFTITGITQADPAVVTLSASANILTGHEVEIDSVVGMTELNGRRFRVTRVSATEFSLQNVDSTNFTAYSSGGTLTTAYAEEDSNSTTPEIDVSWNEAPNAIRYIIYREKDGVFGFVGETQDLTFSDDVSNNNVNLEDTVPFFRDPFFGEDNRPRTFEEYQQRGAYGGTDDAPSTVEISKTGSPSNFSRSLPSKDDDAFRITINSRNQATIRHLIALKDLIALTDTSIQSISSKGKAFTFQNTVVEKQESFGASLVSPLIASQHVLFEEENGGRVHAARFSFSVDGLEIQDISIFSSHFLENDRIKDWTYSASPNPVAYAAMESGKVCAITFNPKTGIEVTAWTQWETDGSFESITSLRAAPQDTEQSEYVVVKRTVGGNTVRYIEKLAKREVDDVKDCFYLDSGVTFEDAYDIDSISAADPVEITSAGHGLSDGDIVDISDIVWEPTVNKDFVSTFPDDLNGRRYEVQNSTSNTFELKNISTGGDVDGTDLPTRLSGGKVRRAVTSVSGLDHLAGRTVVGLLDGSVQRDITVDSTGAVSLPSRASRVHLGLPYYSEMVTLPYETQSPKVNTGRRFSIPSVSLRLYKTRGVLTSRDGKDFNPWKQREFEKYGQPTQLFSGTVNIQLPPNSDSEGSIYLRQVNPLPFAVLAIAFDAQSSK